jgi:hypothetical protein
MLQMFDWIFFAIVLPVPAFLAWDWFKNRDVGSQEPTSTHQL